MKQNKPLPKEVSKPRKPFQVYEEDIKQLEKVEKIEASGELTALAKIVGDLSGKMDRLQSQTPVINIHNLPPNIIMPEKKEDDMQVIINNPQSVDITNEKTLELMKSMTQKVGDVLSASLAPTINLPAPIIQVQPSDVNVAAPIVNVNVPEQSAPQVNISVEPTPIQNQVNVSPTPVVNENNISVEQPDITVNVPEKGKKNIRIIRDVNGKVVGAEETTE